MHVKVDRQDGQTTSYFGVTDFAVLEDDRIELYWPPETDRPEEETVRGRLRQAVDHQAYNHAGLAEVITGLACNSDVTVVVESSRTFPRLAEFAEE